MGINLVDANKRERDGKKKSAREVGAECDEKRSGDHTASGRARRSARAVAGVVEDGARGATRPTFLAKYSARAFRILTVLPAAFIQVG